MRIILSVLWLAAAGTGFALILNYQSSNGVANAPPEHWPSGTQLVLDSKHDTLVMFAHPQCPCTEASMEELNRLLARSAGKCGCTSVVFQTRLIFLMTGPTQICGRLLQPSRV